MAHHLPEWQSILQSCMRDLCKHRWWKKGGQYEDTVLNGLSWHCWAPLIKLHISGSFRVFISNDTLRIHLLFPSFEIYSEHIFKGYSTLTFIMWTDLCPMKYLAVWFWLLYTWFICECVWIRPFLFIAYSCLIAGMCKQPRFKGCSWLDGHRNFRQKQRILDEKMWTK